MDDEKIYVSKGEVVLALLEKGQRSKRYKLGESWELNLFEIQEAIDEMPAADVQPVKHGKWIPQGNDMWLCSNCKENIIYSTTKSDRTEKQRYCCRCGARMDAIYQDDNITAIKVTGWDGDTK